MAGSSGGHGTYLEGDHKPKAINTIWCKEVQTVDSKTGQMKNVF